MINMYLKVDTIQRLRIEEGPNTVKNMKMHDYWRSRGKVRLHDPENHGGGHGPPAPPLAQVLLYCMHLYTFYN